MRTAPRVIALLLAALGPSVAATSCGTPVICEPGRYLVCSCPCVAQPLLGAIVPVSTTAEGGPPPAAEGGPLLGAYLTATAGYLSTQTCNKEGTGFDACVCADASLPMCDPAATPAGAGEDGG